jgi:hypothetical protein
MLKQRAVGHLEELMEAAAGMLPPPPPPFPPPGEGDEPDAASFVGSIIFFISFASALADVLESDNSGNPFAAHAEYSDTPIYNAMALGVGSLSYFLAFMGYEAFQLDGSGHILLTGFTFTLFVRHVGKRNEMGRRRLNTLCGLSVMPFLTLACAKEERIKFRSCKMLTVVMATIATLPLGALFRDYRGAVYDPRVSKLRKRMLWLFVSLFLYIIISMPATVCTKRLQSIGHSNVLLAFDLFTLLLGSDAVWST